MKKFPIRVLTGAAVLSFLLAGCSKGKNDASPAPAAASNPNAAVLKIKWVPGKRYTEELTFGQALQLTPHGSLPVEQTMKTAENFTVSVLKQLTNGGVELEFSFTQVKMETVEGGKTTMKFDSAVDFKPPANVSTNGQEGGLAAAHLRLLTDGSGKVSEVENYPEFIHQIQAGLKTAGALQFFRLETLKELAMPCQYLPGDSVQVGEIWPVRFKTSSGLGESLMTNMRGVFKKWEVRDGRRCAYLEFTGTLASERTNNVMKTDDIVIEDGKIAIKTWFDPDLAAQVASSSEQIMSVSVNDGGKSMKVPVTQTMSRTLKTVSDLPK